MNSPKLTYMLSFPFGPEAQYAWPAQPENGAPGHLVHQKLIEAQSKLKPEEAATFYLTTDADLGVRPILLKGYDPDNITFRFVTTTYGRKRMWNAKGGALCFHWRFPNRDEVLRAEGRLSEVTGNWVHDYWKTRPVLAQAASTLSCQSLTMPMGFIKFYFQIVKLAAANPRGLPCPDFWRAYDLRARRIELWSQGDWRIHKRLEWKRVTNEDGSVNWQPAHLYP